MLSCLTWTNRNVMRMNETVLGAIIYDHTKRTKAEKSIYRINVIVGMRPFCLLIRSWEGGTQGQRLTKWKHNIALILISLFLRPFSNFCDLDVFSLVCFIWWLLEFYFAVRQICMNCNLYQVSTLLCSLHVFFCIKNLFYSI